MQSTRAKILASGVWLWTFLNTTMKLPIVSTKAVEERSSRRSRGDGDDPERASKRLSDGGSTMSTAEERARRVARYGVEIHAAPREACPGGASVEKEWSEPVPALTTRCRMMCTHSVSTLGHRQSRARRIPRLGARFSYA